MLDLLIGRVALLLGVICFAIVIYKTTKTMRPSGFHIVVEFAFRSVEFLFLGSLITAVSSLTLGEILLKIGVNPEKVILFFVAAGFWLSAYLAYYNRKQ
jgi:hypothetical protein